MSEDQDPTFFDQLRGLESRLKSVEDQADPDLLIAVRGVVRSVLELHSRGLERFLELAGDGPEGAALREKLAADELVSGMLLLHELHPLPLASRLRHAITEADDELRALGGVLELVSVDNRAARFRLQRLSSLKSWELARLEAAVEELIQGAGPELEDVEIVQALSAGAARPLPLASAEESGGGG